MKRSTGSERAADSSECAGSPRYRASLTGQLQKLNTVDDVVMWCHVIMILLVVDYFDKVETKGKRPTTMFVLVTADVTSYVLQVESFSGLK